jgi:hypothetical protein
MDSSPSYLKRVNNSSLPSGLKREKNWYINFYPKSIPSSNHCNMTTQNQVGFVTDKIKQLQTAILHSHSNCPLKFPDSLAKTLQVDEAGCIWIAVKKPQQYIHEFDRSFQVALNYYRKGTSFYLNISGVARLVIEPEEINQLAPELRSECNQGNLLLAVRILRATYYENQPRTSQNIFQRWKQFISTIFSGYNNYYQFDMADKKNYA